VKGGWQTTTLGDVCHVYQPETISQKQLRPGEFRVYGANGQIGWHNAFNHDASQLILGCRGSCGTVHFTEPCSWINGNAMVVQPTDGLIDINFLAYALKGGIDLRDAITGTAQPQITRTSLMPLAISFPESLTEQRRIVTLLDEAFEALATAKANAEQSLQNARALFESRLQSIFDQQEEAGPTYQLGDVCDFQGGSQPPKSQFSYIPKDGYVRFLQIRDFGSEKHITYIPKSRKNRLCTENDTMIGRYGASVGKILTGKAGAYNVALMKATPDGKLLEPNYFHYYLLSGAFQNRLSTVAARSAQNGFSKEDIHSFPVSIPSLEQQRYLIDQIAALAKETQHLTSIYERKLAALEELNASLMHQAFNGEL
jgi:type I restriction enzyme, S subunit